MAKINAGTITADGAGNWSSDSIDMGAAGAKTVYMRVNGSQVLTRNFTVTASGVAIDVNTGFNAAAASTATASAVSYSTGNIIVVAAHVHGSNQVSGITVGGNAATLRSRVRGWTGTTQVTHPQYIYSYAAAGNGPGDVVVTFNGASSATYRVWVCSGASSVLPTTPPFNEDTAPSGGRAATNNQTGATVQDVVLALSSANSVRPAAGSIIIGVQGTFTGTWTNGTMGGAARTAYSADTVVDETRDLDDWTCRGTMFHSVQCSGSADYTIGTTSTDGAVHYNICVVEVAV